MGNNIFDISRYNCSSVNDFVFKYKNTPVRCQNHDDKNPSAQVNDNNVWCYVCSDYFFYEEFVEKEPTKHVYNNNQQNAEIYHKQLINSKNQSDIRKFLQLRKINDDIAKDFQLGFTNSDPIWKAGALVFPIKNKRGNINGFGYRRIIENNDNKPPKYWNDKDKDNDEHSVFCKSSNLYGMDKVSDECKHLIICEGYIDVISAYKNGFKDNICFVSIMGIALTDNHIPPLATIINNINKISLMLDNDITGLKATIRAIGILLKAEIYPNVIFNFKDEPDYKDIDELLTKKDGKDRLGTLLNKHCHDWCDYLIKTLDKIDGDDTIKVQDLLTVIKQVIKLSDNENVMESELQKTQDNWSKREILTAIIKQLIKLIKNKEINGFYASKLCAVFNFYESIKPKSKIYPDILSLDKDGIKGYFMKEESYFNCKLPKYFKFNDVLKLADNLIQSVKFEDKYDTGIPKPNSTENYKKTLYEQFKLIENVNYKILGNKNGEYAWRQYQIINPVLYVKLVNVISDNWDSIKEHFEKNIKIEESIKCVSMPVIEKPNDRFSNNTARQIINWWDGMEQESIKKALEYRYVIQTDIVDCYGSIYTHSIPWALHGMQNAKDNRDNHNLIGNKIDTMLQCMNYGQTNGIPQGSTIMDFIAEILLYYIDMELYERCQQEGLKYYILRYRDDYRIFANEVGIAKKVLKFLGEILIETGGMRLSSEKTNVSDCVVSGSIKKDKLYYFECFKEHESIRKNILNIYLFAKKYPNSGSILKLLQLFREKIKKTINEISRKILDHVPIEYIEDLDAKYVASILSEIMYLHPRTYGIACSIIFDIMSIMNNEERILIWQNISDKMQDVPNNELLHIWLERMVYVNYNDTDGWHKFFEYCSKDAKRTLLYKSYANDKVWNFPSIDVCNKIIQSLNTSSILDEEIKDKLDRAKNKEYQRIDINEPFTIDEINPFEYGL